jgi:acyl-coenzyme A thioesterase PaaI-like protein
VTERAFARIDEWGRGTLLRNTNRGTLTAEAEIVHHGRTTIVVDVRVCDEQDRLVAPLTATQLTPGSAVPAGR